MKRFRKSRQADEDIIALYVQGHDLFGAPQAEAYLDGLQGLFQRLADNPGLARLRTEYDPPSRIVAYKAHVVVYDEEQDGIVVVRVRHGREDWWTDPRGTTRE